MGISRSNNKETVQSRQNVDMFQRKLKDMLIDEMNGMMFVILFN